MVICEPPCPCVRFFIGEAVEHTFLGTAAGDPHRLLAGTLPLFELRSLQVPLLTQRSSVCLKDLPLRDPQGDGLARRCADLAKELFGTKVGKRKLEEFHRIEASSDYALTFVLLGGEIVLRNLAWKETAYRRVCVHVEETSGEEWVPWGRRIYRLLLLAASQKIRWR